MSNVTIQVVPPGDGTVVQLKGGDVDVSRMSMPAYFSEVPEGYYQVHVHQQDRYKVEDVSVKGNDFTHTIYL